MTSAATMLYKDACGDRVVQFLRCSIRTYTIAIYEPAPWSSILSGKLTVAHLVKIFSAFCGTEGSLSCSQGLALDLTNALLISALLWWKTQITKLFFSQFSATSYYILRSKDTPQRPTHKTPSTPYSSLTARDKVSHSYKTKGKILKHVKILNWVTEKVPRVPSYFLHEHNFLFLIIIPKYSNIITFSKYLLVISIFWSSVHVSKPDLWT